MKIAKKIRHIIRWFMPFGVVRWYAQKHRQKPNNEEEEKQAPKNMPKTDFMTKYHEYLKETKRAVFAEDSPFETIVTVQGFGYSGSGAVVDLLREYQNVRVVGFVDAEGSLSTSNEECEEVDILRLSGGLFEVEKYLGCNNIFQNDALLHRVVDLLEQSSIYRCYPEIHECFYEFLRQICHVYENRSQEQFYNVHISYHGYNDILALNQLSIEEYRSLCRRFINSILSVFRTSDTKKYLVLDQFIADCEYDFERYQQYIPNLKSLVVYRDPRDIFVFAKSKHEDWIPTNDVLDYVRWYKDSTKFFNQNENALYHVVQFESMINEYDKEVAKIELYLGLDEELHVWRRHNFDPDVSCENIGLYTKYSTFNQELVVIAQELDNLCYPSKHVN